MNPQLVAGADVGGTSTRVAVADTDGRVLALARGGPGNPKSVGPDVAAETIATTLARSLDRARKRLLELGGELGRNETVGPFLPTAVTVGLAGLTGVGDLPGFVARALPGVDPEVVTVVPDLVAAFASGTPEPSGYVVLAGTGAGAMAIEDGAVTGRHDAWGWLLGDDGSGFWLGRESVRATLTALEPAFGRPGDEHAARGPLAREVLLRTGTEDFASLLAAVYARPAPWLAELAPAVTGAAAVDPVAAGICDRAAALLAGSFHALRPVPGRTVVTTGSVLYPGSPVRQALIRAIGSPWCTEGTEDAAELRSVSDGIAGSLWLSLRNWHRRRGLDRWPESHSEWRPQWDSEGNSEAAVHARLVQAVAATPQ